MLEYILRSRRKSFTFTTNTPLFSVETLDVWNPYSLSIETRFIACGLNKEDQSPHSFSIRSYAIYETRCMCYDSTVHIVEPLILASHDPLLGALETTTDKGISSI